MHHTKSANFTLSDNDDSEWPLDRVGSAPSISSIARYGIPWACLDMSRPEAIAGGDSGAIIKGRFGKATIVLRLMDPERTRLQKCCKKLLTLSHTNILKFYGICADDDLVSYKHVSLIMEYCPRGDLKRRIHRSRQIKKDSFIKWCRQLASGMAYLHSESLAHRNLKPQNILFDADKNLKIGGFTLCKEMRAEDGNTFCGTALYMAPEIVAGPRHSKMVDLWSFAVVIREMLTQMHPYASRNAASIVIQLGDISTRNMWPEDFVLLPPKDCPQSLSELMKHCLCPDFRLRPTFDDVLIRMSDIEAELAKMKDDEWNSKKKFWRSAGRREKRKSVA